MLTVKKHLPDNMADLKKQRGIVKGSVTREINYVLQLIAEEAASEVISQRVERVKGIFKDFTTSHLKYHDSLDEEVDIENSERYFQKEQTGYILMP